MVTQIELGGVSVDVLQKDIKNVHLSVHPPTGRVRISAPSRMSLDTIRVFAVAKLDWIRRHQRKLRDQERESPREFLDRESHFVWGRRYLLSVLDGDCPSSVELSHSRLILRIRLGADNHHRRHDVLENWYRTQVREATPPLIAKWERLMGVKVERFFVQRMKTKWGSCNSRARTIRLNTDLAKKPRECLEYLIVHEMVHLLEPTHNARFLALMERFMPRWLSRRELLNSYPVRHEDWRY